MYRSRADRRHARRKLNAARRMMSVEAFEREGLNRYNFRKCGVATLFPYDKRRDNMLDRLRAEHARLDLAEAAYYAADESAQHVEHADEYYDYLERLDREEYYDYLDELYRQEMEGDNMDRLGYEKDAAWSMYHEFISVDAHNGTLRERHWDAEYPEYPDEAA